MKGLGNDIIEIERISKSIQRMGDAFLSRVLTENEIAYCKKFSDPMPHYAARFAAKEAISKAFGTGIGEAFGWHDVEISHEEKGKPIAIFSEKTMARFDHPKVLLSLSHCNAYATAVAIWL